MSPSAAGRRLALAAALLLGLGGAGALLAQPASAHQRARAELRSPAEGSVVTGVEVEVVVAAVGPGQPAEFRLYLDDAQLDGTGRVGGVFGTIRVDPGSELRLAVALGREGAHVLRLVPAPHEQPDPEVLRRFTSTAAGASAGSTDPTATSTGTATADPAATATGTVPPAAPPTAESHQISRGTVLVTLLGALLLGSGLGAVIVSRAR